MALADAHGCADMGDTDDTGTADARAKSGSTAASRVEAERLRWNPTLGDDAVPLVGEWKYPLDKPHGPVMCTSRRVLTGGHPGVDKQIMREGSATEPPPADGATCFVHYDMWQLNASGDEAWSTRRESEPHQILVGKAIPVTDGKRRHHPALYECVRAMRPGERCLFRVPPELCYGEEGNFSFPAVPPNCWMLVDVELIGVKGEAMERADMLYEERIERVKSHRMNGNTAFRGGDVPAAAREYEMSLSFLTDDMMMQLFGEYLEEAEGEKLPAHLNLCACYLKMERYHDAVDQAGRALGVDPENPKAFYRRGKARRALGQDDGARADLTKALAFSEGATDPAIERAIAELDGEERRKHAARRGVFGGLFDASDRGGDTEEAQASIDDVNDAEPTRSQKEEARRRGPGSGFFGRVFQRLGRVSDVLTKDQGTHS
jgi:hypothetical protein